MRILAVIFPLILGLGLSGCPALDFKELDFTREKPRSEDLVGKWVPTRNSLKDMRTRGHYPEANHEIELRSDGTFTMLNMPDWWSRPWGDSGKGFDSGTGTWEFIEGKNVWRIWELEFIFKGKKSGRTVNLSKQKAPYHLFFRVGDPNDGYATIFERITPN